MTNVRWTVVALIFFATTINYIDRQVIGLLKPYIQEDLGWTEADYGYIVTAFQIAYGIGMLLGGRMLDRFGSKLGYSIAIVVWSIGAVLHATVRSVTGFGAARAILGLGEAGNLARPCLCHRTLQLRNHDWSHYCPHHRNSHYIAMGMAMGFYRNGYVGIHLGSNLVGTLSFSQETSSGE